MQAWWQAAFPSWVRFKYETHSFHTTSQRHAARDACRARQPDRNGFQPIRPVDRAGKQSPGIGAPLQTAGTASPAAASRFYRVLAP
ncbi:MAG: hypothetical protein EXS31_15850 [Pedosphaera sp.]|nr:hypothetical protein [Pedosphaera sp.]